MTIFTGSQVLLLHGPAVVPLVKGIQLESFHGLRVPDAERIEALEKWPIDLFQRLLPRIYQIVEEINRRFIKLLEEKYYGGDVQDKICKMAILYNGRMGIVELESHLLREPVNIVMPAHELLHRLLNGSGDKICKMAILYNGQVRMAHMAIIAGYSVNGVARLHTEILKNQELRDFYELYPKMELGSTLTPLCS